MEIKVKLAESLKFLRAKVSLKPTIGIVLGSGLGEFAETLENEISIDTEEIPHYAKSTVEGHAGRVVFGTLHDKTLMVFKGRVHFYEGYSMEQVTYNIRLMGAMGVKSLIVTNAAGGVNITFSPGDLMFITSQINHFFANPLQGKNDEAMGPRFPDMESEFDAEYISIAEKVATELKIRTQRGVYAGNSGPTYETRAEVRMFQKMGADAVGMSTIPEVIVAKHQGMRVLGISCVTNLGTGISQTKLSHAEVTETANRVKNDFQALLKETIKQI